MNTELEGFALTLFVVIAAVMLLASGLRLLQRHHGHQLAREIDEELARTAALRRVSAEAPGVGQA
jgi:hypothetical protein